MWVRKSWSGLPALNAGHPPYLGDLGQATGLLKKASGPPSALGLSVGGGGGAGAEQHAARSVKQGPAVVSGRLPSDTFLPSIVISVSRVCVNAYVNHERTRFLNSGLRPAQHMLIKGAACGRVSAGHAGRRRALTQIPGRGDSARRGELTALPSDPFQFQQCDTLSPSQGL